MSEEVTEQQTTQPTVTEIDVMKGAITNSTALTPAPEPSDPLAEVEARLFEEYKQKLESVNQAFRISTEAVEKWYEEKLIALETLKPDAERLLTKQREQQKLERIIQRRTAPGYLGSPLQNFERLIGIPEESAQADAGAEQHVPQSPPPGADKGVAFHETNLVHQIISSLGTCFTLQHLLKAVNTAGPVAGPTGPLTLDKSRVQLALNRLCRSGDVIHYVVARKSSSDPSGSRSSSKLIWYQSSKIKTPIQQSVKQYYSTQVKLRASNK